MHLLFAFNLLWMLIELVERVNFPMSFKTFHELIYIDNFPMSYCVSGNILFKLEQLKLVKLSNIGHHQSSLVIASFTTICLHKLASCNHNLLTDNVNLH